MNILQYNILQKLFNILDVQIVSKKYLKKLENKIFHFNIRNFEISKYRSF